jgi:hypothetical protein
VHEKYCKLEHEYLKTIIIVDAPANTFCSSAVDDGTTPKKSKLSTSA